MRVSNGRVALTTRERLGALIISAANVALAIVIYVFVSGVLDSKAFEKVNAASYDNVLAARTDRARNSMTQVNKWKDKVVVIRIDDATLEKKQFDRWPVNRKYYAEMIDMLAKAKVRSIGIDILFLDASHDPGSDAALARAVQQHDEVILVNHIRSTDGTFEDPMPALTRGWSEEKRQQRIGVTVESSVDGVVKKVPPVITAGKKQRYLFDVLLAAREMKIPFDRIRDHSDVGFGEGSVYLGDTRVPVDNGEMYINYFWGAAEEATLKGGPDDVVQAAEQRLNYYSFSDLWEMDDETREYLFKDRTVLVGVTAEAGEDVKATPMGPMAGVDIHAQVLLSLLSGEFLRPVPAVQKACVLLVIALLMGLAIPRLHWALGGMLAVVLGFGIFAGLPYMWIYDGEVYDPALPVLALALAFTNVTIFQLILERRAKQRLSQLVQQVAPMPDKFITEYLASKQQYVKMGGVMEHVSILFSDIRGYTDMSEKMEAVTLMNTLNEFYTEMGHIVKQHGGHIFDYQGDAQMVVFGLDEAHAHHADEAVQAALEMIGRLDELNEQWAREQRPSVEIGIGVCTGDVSLGFMGSDLRRQYSAIGDTTNLAARMQSMSSQLGSKVLVSESTMAELKGGYVTEKVTGVKVKGKSEEQTVFKVFSLQSDAEMVTR